MHVFVWLLRYYSHECNDVFCEQAKGGSIAPRRVTNRRPFETYVQWSVTEISSTDRSADICAVLLRSSLPEQFRAMAESMWPAVRDDSVLQKVVLPADVELALCSHPALFLPVLDYIACKREERGRGAFAVTPLSSLWDIRFIPFSTTMVRFLVQQRSASGSILEAFGAGLELARADVQRYRDEPARSYRQSSLVCKVRSPVWPFFRFVHF
jgi:hypothetical protein